MLLRVHYSKSACVHDQSSVYYRSPNDAVSCLLAEKTATNTAGHGAHETTLALLRVVGITGVLCVSVRV